ncbi:hypothetical protein I0C86_28085 [Plantactinospora sp. S1510]|uniref:Uncharacterized protein n=1 Tax=Plantactinospora alkalitolerans TaxID=2789879 RepID=A0ABS0H2V0_9ACTN|nr:hypothetical protein [Plantactinospora alkalitolerans]MBF9132786.1 hypothetical protein [Plantactinospora alkalitolerans]
MGKIHGHADNIVYDLVSIQYHALKGGQVYEQYKSDAEGHDDIRQFIERIQREDIDRAQRAQELLAMISNVPVGVR